jgi:Dimethlysulfonioproprionate lyase
VTTAGDIAARIKRLLVPLQQTSLAPFLSEWPTSCMHRTTIRAELPVLRWIPDIAADTAAFGTDVVAALCRASPSLAWRQTYSARQVEAEFLDNYGWAEILGAHGPLASERIACGFLLLGPATHYPRHRHEAEEFYLPLSGTAAWQQADTEWRERPPGSAIYHASGEPHAMRTGSAPLLALYLWRSADLAQKARLDAAAT